MPRHEALFAGALPARTSARAWPSRRRSRSRALPAPPDRSSPERLRRPAKARAPLDRRRVHIEPCEQRHEASRRRERGRGVRALPDEAAAEPPRLRRARREVALRRSDRLRARSSRLAREQPHRSLRRGRRSPLPNFWCTACFETPSGAAICCQLQPSSRARRTCSSSTASTRARSDATARSPTSGSSLANFLHHHIASAVTAVVKRTDERVASTSSPAGVSGPPRSAPRGSSPRRARPKPCAVR